MKNLLADISTDSQDELVATIAESSCARIERIVSHGQSSPTDFWYDQSENEWVLVLAGNATLQMQNPNELIELSAGDHLVIAAHRKHRVAWTDPKQPTVWLAVFYGD